MVKALVTALRDHEGYNQHLVACVAQVAERIAAEYSANVQSATISVLRNESAAGEPTPRNVRGTPDTPTSVEHEDTRAPRNTKARKKGSHSSGLSDSITSMSASMRGGPTGEHTPSTTIQRRRARARQHRAVYAVDAAALRMTATQDVEAHLRSPYVDRTRHASEMLMNARRTHG